MSPCGVQHSAFSPQPSAFDPIARGLWRGFSAFFAGRPCWASATSPQSPIPNLHSPIPSPPSPIPRKSAVACCLLLLLAGCSGPQPDGGRASPGAALAGVKLRLLVAGDPELAAAVRQLHGEWNAQTGSEFQVESTRQQQFDAGVPFSADALICPSHEMGPLAERKLLAPIPQSLLRVNAGDWSDVFELLRLSEAAWVGKPLAVPFGSPVFVCYYRADLLEKLGRQPPKTWAEYQELAELLARRQNLGAAEEKGVRSNLPERPQGCFAQIGPDPLFPAWSGTVEPLAPGWAALVLLARSAAYAKHRDNYSTLFDIRTMKPLVAGPPFVRALEELVAAAKLGSPDQLQYDPADARAAFWQGRCGMALTWPTAAAGGLPAGVAENVTASIRVGFAELPGSPKVFNVRKQSWENRAEEEDPHVPLTAVAGRIGVVARSSAHPAAALQLLFWLSGKQFSSRVSASSPATTLFRQSHLSAPRVWVEKPVSPRAAAQYAEVAEKAFSREQWVFALRIPGRREYLAALDEAVRRAVRGEQPAREALREAAARWQQITERLGLDQQRAAYCHSLGREP
jgi:multiple sugar transport system substrate-binding protein